MKISRIIDVQKPGLAIELLVEQCPELSKGRLKDAMNKGAVLWRQGKQHKRLRRSQSPVQAGARLELHYDDDLLSRPALAAELIADERDYSIWFKPAGMLSQGNEWGDHLALLRYVEQQVAPKRTVFLVHRLDREASGLVIIAHTKAAAAHFSQLIQQHKIRKTYQIMVKGVLSAAWQQCGVITSPLDGKASETRFMVKDQQSEPARSLLEVQLISGRKHQIRRHFAEIGHPVMGDPQYGQGNRNDSGLALEAIELGFDWPKAGARHYRLPLALQRLGPFQIELE